MRGSQSADKENDDEKVSLDGEELNDDEVAASKTLEELELVEQEGGYLVPVDYIASQEQESFETMIKKAEKGKLDVNEMERLRRCDRLKDKEDCNISELATKRAAEKDNYGEHNFPTSLSAPPSYLQKVAGGVGVSLGKNIDVVEHNIKLIKDVEQTRIDLWVENNNNNNNKQSALIPGVDPVIETGEHSLRN